MPRARPFFLDSNGILSIISDRRVKVIIEITAKNGVSQKGKSTSFVLFKVLNFNRKNIDYLDIILKD